MSEVTIDQINEAIAVFMGGISDGKKYMLFPDQKVYIYHSDYSSQLKYHSSWDWLMPVVDKITKIGFFVRMSFHSLCGPSVLIVQSMPPNKSDFTISRSCGNQAGIDAVHEAVYQFIQWYNKQKEVTNG